jgi:hypothetical protein
MLLHCTILLGLLACAHTFVLSGGRFGRQGVLRSQNAGNVEEDLFGLEGGVEVVKEEKAQPKGSGVGKLFEDAIVMLGKVPNSKVRAMIVENGAEPPFPMEESLEMHGYRRHLECEGGRLGDILALHAGRAEGRGGGGYSTYAGGGHVCG